MMNPSLEKKYNLLGMDAASLSVTCPCQKCALAAGRSDGDPNHEHVEGRMDVPMRSFFAGKFQFDIDLNERNGT
jgi:hypothetical protein